MNFDLPNLIVGSELREFLGLGIRHGFFELEQLVYDRDDTAALLDQEPHSADVPTAKISALATLRQTFGIRPWRDHEKRIAELQAAFPLE